MSCNRGISSQASLLLLPTLNMECAPYKNCDFWDSHSAFYFLLCNSEKTVDWTDGTFSAVNFFGGGLHRTEIESQDKVKKHKWSCHVGK